MTIYDKNKMKCMTWIEHAHVLFNMGKELEELVNSIKLRVEQLETEVVELFNRVEQLEADVAELFTRVSSLESRMTSLENRVTSLEARVTQVEADIDALEIRCTNLETRMTSAETEIVNVKARLTQAENNIDYLEEHKQNKLTAGTGITIDENDVISAKGEEIQIVWGNITGTISNQEDLRIALSNLDSDITEVRNNLLSEVLTREEQYDFLSDEIRVLEEGKEDKLTSASAGNHIRIVRFSSGIVQISAEINWGDIGGELLNQNDLMAMLDRKAELTDVQALETRVDFLEETVSSLGTRITTLELGKQDKLTAENAGENITIEEIEGVLKISATGEIATNWGNIGGDITTQQDLMDLFDEKADVSVVTELEEEVDSLGQDVNEINTTKLPAKQDKLTAGYGISIIDNVISFNGSIPALTWGNITGNISSQTDLMNQFGLKQDKLSAENAGENITIEEIEGVLKISATGQVAVAWGNISGNISDQEDLNEVITSFTDEITSIYERLSDKVDKTDFETLKERVGTTEDDIKTIEGEIIDIQSTITTLSSTVQGLDSRVGAIEADVISHGGRITALEGDLRQAQADILSVGNRVTALETSIPQVLDEIQDRVSALETDVSGLETSKQNVLTAGTGISIVNDVISATGTGGVAWGDITGRLGDQTDLMDLFGTKAEKADLNTLTTRVTNNETAIANLVTRITADEEDIEGIQEEVSGLMTELGALSQSLSTHVNNSTIHITATERTTWNGKQNALSTAQLNACNSGITAAKVSTYDGYSSSKQNTLSTAQLNACNSGITAAKVSTYDGYSSSKQNTLSTAQLNACNSGITAALVTTLSKMSVETWTFTLEGGSTVTKKVVISS